MPSTAMKINDFNFHISKEIVAYIQPMLALYGIIDGGEGGGIVI